MSVGILLLGLHQISTGILQGLGRTSIPVINMILAAAVKVFLSWTLTAIPTLGIKGAAMATVVDFGLAAVLNMILFTNIQVLLYPSAVYLSLLCQPQLWERRFMALSRWRQAGEPGRF